MRCWGPIRGSEIYWGNNSALHPGRDRSRRGDTNSSGQGLRAGLRSCVKLETNTKGLHTAVQCAKGTYLFALGDDFEKKLI